MIGSTRELIGIDSNVILRYLLRDDAGQYLASKQLLESLTVDSPGFLTQVALAEIHWVLSRGAKFDRRSCLSVMRGLLEREVLEFDDAEGAVQALELAEEGADFADALVETTMQQFGATRTVTFDRRAADQLGWERLGAADPAEPSRETGEAPSDGQGLPLVRPLGLEPRTH